MISWTKLLNASDRRGEDRPSGYMSPAVVVWNVTARCNLSCRHCYFNASGLRDAERLKRKEAEDFIGDLACTGVPAVIFSGGEPLLEEEIFETAAFAHDRGLRTSLSTNGTLITKKVAREIKNSGFSYVGLSLDGVGKTNDSFRQSEGAFGRAVEGMRNCMDAGLRTGLRITLTKYNFMDLSRVFDLAEEESVSRVCVYHLVYTGRGSDIRGMDLTHDETRSALELIWQRVAGFAQSGRGIEVLTVDNHADGAWLYLKMKREYPERAGTVLELLKGHGGNASGERIAAVDNQGNVYPDQFWRQHPLGNVRERRFREIWQDESNMFLKALRNRRAYLKGRCRRCGFLGICNGNFRARAESVSGDMWQEDPGCFLTDEEIGLLQ